ncbi:MAG: S8 family serine peptidase [Phycisphaeraceae bacterium]|nr:S8 family serine peptidase [Phycisphaeraceae bacterium]
MAKTWTATVFANPLMRQRLIAAAWLAMLTALLVAAPRAQAIQSTTYAYDINALFGANTFYDAGYTGTRAVVANIEAGLAWNQHETLTHVSTLLYDPTHSGPHVGEFDYHATEVAQAAAGRGDTAKQRGFAYGATLWSGAIASDWPSAPTGTSFSFTRQSFLYPYVTSLRTAVSGRKADVVNSSWGYSETSTTGFNWVTCVIDTLAWESGKTVVLAAGNGGPTTNSVLAPGTGYNGITVGAVGNESTTPPYVQYASFSSRGPGDYLDPTSGEVITGVRAQVDILAPGSHFTLARYGGTTGSNTGGTDPTGGATNLYNTNQTGTSFASPIVAGGAALLVDAGYDRYGGGTSVDGRVIKAVLLNSAYKDQAWTNNQQNVAGVIRTAQSLDYNRGAGVIDLKKAFSQYTVGTHDLPNLTGGTAYAVGWDYGSVSESSGNTDYYLSQPLAANSKLTVTLDWFVQRSFNTNTMNVYNEVCFDNLDLQVWSVVNGLPSVLVAESVSQYNNVEHLDFALPQTGHYMVRVHWAGQNFDFTSSTKQESYGLAWSAQPVLGDLNGDGLVNVQDINPFVLALADAGQFALTYPNVLLALTGDMSGDGLVDVQDINPFVALLAGSAGIGSDAAMSLLPQALQDAAAGAIDPTSLSVIPEPASAMLLLVGAGGVFMRRRGSGR